MRYDANRRITGLNSYNIGPILVTFRCLFLFNVPTLNQSWC